MRISNEFDIEKTFVEDLPITTEAPRCAADIMPGIGRTRLGSGVVTDIIGSGGMAVIYKVWNDKLEVFRAVKLLAHDKSGARFETEAKITAKLHHEGIVEVYNVGEWNGRQYMEMEFIDGEDLRQTLDRCGRFPEAVCVGIGILIARALLSAHTLSFTLGGKSYNGIIHRDLKPANIMITKQGSVKLTDFGIARPAESGLHTVEKNIVGTLHYLSPEQMEGKEIDCKSDLYSFGTILYEMATGVKTFPQDSIADLMRQKSVNNFKLPSELGVTISQTLTDIIIKCLKYDPNKRYKTACEPIDDLTALLETITDKTPQEILYDFLHNASGGKPATQKFPPKTKTTRAIITPKTTTSTMMSKGAIKKFTALTPPILICIILISYILTKAPSTKDTTLTADSANTPETPTITTDTIKTAAPPDTQAAPAPVPPRPIAKNAPPERPQPPARSESEMLRDAAEAIDKKLWSKAIKILEDESAYKELSDRRTLLLLEAYVGSNRLEKARAIIDTSTLSQDAHFLISAGRYQYLIGNHTKAIGILESALTRPSISKKRNILFGDALYYIAVIKQERFNADPSDQNRKSAEEAWLKASRAAGRSPARY